MSEFSDMHGHELAFYQIIPFQHFSRLNTEETKAMDSWENENSEVSTIRNSTRLLTLSRIRCSCGHVACKGAGGKKFEFIEGWYARLQLENLILLVHLILINWC